MRAYQNICSIFKDMYTNTVLCKMVCKTIFRLHIKYIIDS